MTPPLYQSPYLQMRKERLKESINESRLAMDWLLLKLGDRDMSGFIMSFCLLLCMFGSFHKEMTFLWIVFLKIPPVQFKCDTVHLYWVSHHCGEQEHFCHSQGSSGNRAMPVAWPWGEEPDKMERKFRVQSPKQDLQTRTRINLEHSTESI